MNDLKRHSSSGKKHIVYLGEAGFPIGFGAVQRMILVSKSLLFENCKVTVLCRKGIIRNPGINLESKGSFEGIEYVYTSGTVFRPKGFIKRNLLKIRGMLGEFQYLVRLKNSDNITAAIISSHDAVHVIRYYMYSRLIGFPIVLNFVELASSMKGREKLSTRINDYVFDHFIIRIVDGALPISNKLISYYKKIAPSKPCLKLPILCDFDKFNLESKNKEEIVFLYCGAASYFELIDFVIDAFEQLKKPQKHVVFELILGGKEAELDKVKQRIDNAVNKDNIRLITNVDHFYIPQYYANASALLIPLRPTIQDEARFPHKIGEYLASGRPMITTAFGEINNYDFTDKETALVAKDYNVISFSEKMKYIIEEPQKSYGIGMKGRQMGLENFDYSKYGKILLNYFSILNHKIK